MIQKFDSESVMYIFIDYLEDSLNQLKESLKENPNDFTLGQYYSFVECLEFLSHNWEKASSAGLYYNIEEKYHLE